MIGCENGSSHIKRDQKRTNFANFPQMFNLKGSIYLFRDLIEKKGRGKGKGLKKKVEQKIEENWKK